MRIASDRYRTAENSLLTKHVVAAGMFAKDAGSTPAASTIFNSRFNEYIEMTAKDKCVQSSAAFGIRQ